MFNLNKYGLRLLRIKFTKELKNQISYNPVNNLNA